MNIKNLVKVFLFLGVVSLVSLFFLNFQGPGGKEEEKFVVGPNELFEDKIIESLFNKGFIKNKSLFVLILDFKGWHGTITPGAYYLSKDLNVYMVAQILSQGPSEKWVVIPPGKRKEQAALILKRTLNWPEEKTLEFLKNAQEGYLFPDTYLVPIEAESAQVVRMMKTNFDRYFDTELQKALLAQNIRNDTAIKIASLIERESGGDADKPIIAAIILNRINNGMRLQIDASVQYAVASDNCQLNQSKPLLESCNFWPRVTSSLLRSTVSPYNTYLKDGLPPGPIASPGLSSIKAVANPAQTNALYYLHSPDKEIHTAETYKEHQENIENFLR